MHRSWMALAQDGKSYDAQETLYRAILRYGVILDQCSLSAALLLFQLVVDKAQSKRCRSSAEVGFTSAQWRLKCSGSCAVATSPDGRSAKIASTRFFNSNVTWPVMREETIRIAER
jgi:hypothetical protein